MAVTLALIRFRMYPCSVPNQITIYLLTFNQHKYTITLTMSKFSSTEKNISDLHQSSFPEHTKLAMLTLFVLLKLENRLHKVVD